MLREKLWVITWPNDRISETATTRSSVLTVHRPQTDTNHGTPWDGNSTKKNLSSNRIESKARFASSIVRSCYQHLRAAETGPACSAPPSSIYATTSAMGINDTADGWKNADHQTVCPTSSSGQDFRHRNLLYARPPGRSPSLSSKHETCA